MLRRRDDYTLERFGIFPSENRPIVSGTSAFGPRGFAAADPSLAFTFVVLPINYPTLAGG